MTFNLHYVPSLFPLAGGRLHRLVPGGIGELPVALGQEARFE